MMVVIVGRHEWGPDELVSLIEVFRDHLQATLLLGDPFNVSPELLADHLAVKSDHGEVFIVEAVDSPLGSTGWDIRVLGATIAIHMFDATPIGGIEAVKSCSLFKWLENALGFPLDALELPS